MFGNLQNTASTHEMARRSRASKWIIRDVAPANLVLFRMRTKTCGDRLSIALPKHHVLACDGRRNHATWTICGSCAGDNGDCGVRCGPLHLHPFAIDAVGVIILEHALDMAQVLVHDEAKSPRFPSHFIHHHDRVADWPILGKVPRQHLQCCRLREAAHEDLGVVSDPAFPTPAGTHRICSTNATWSCGGGASTHGRGRTTLHRGARSATRSAGNRGHRPKYLPLRL
mmetsp:Transcript_18514/g.50832  ORF Transcript_18514/g.50832 Transcript_18514/m.50832 type:complete len:227 (-) Transcript_18514:305-985(-)